MRSLSRYSGKDYVWTQTKASATIATQPLVSKGSGNRVAVIMTLQEGQTLTATNTQGLGTLVGGVVLPFMMISAGKPMAIVTKELIGNLITESLYLGKGGGGSINVCVTEIFDNSIPPC